MGRHTVAETSPDPISGMQAKLKDIAARQDRHKAKLAELSKERQRLAANLRDETKLKVERAIQVGRENEELTAQELREKVLLAKPIQTAHLKENLEKQKRPKNGAEC